ncbi:UDP-glucose 4-epimerase family protein [Vibrio astriarenae]
MTVLITGASGFVGQALLSKFDVAQTRTIGRETPANYPPQQFHELNICRDTDYSLCLEGVTSIVHLAARVHVMTDSLANPLEGYREINTYGTLNLAKQAASAGVKRFVFISSIKVNGESSSLGAPFKYSDEHDPQDDYGKSKSEAEVALLELAKSTGMEVVIIRPTLVYGAGVKGNFASLMRLVAKGLPLPLACIDDNYRSLVSVENLVDLILTCLSHPNAANKVFLVSDDHDLSTAQIVTEMAQALNKKLFLLPVPKWCFKLAGKVANKQPVVERLTGSLQVDIAYTKQTLCWTPPQALRDGFKEAAQTSSFERRTKLK